MWRVGVGAGGTFGCKERKEGKRKEIKSKETQVSSFISNTHSENECILHFKKSTWVPEVRSQASLHPSCRSLLPKALLGYEVAATKPLPSGRCKTREKQRCIKIRQNMQ